METLREKHSAFLSQTRDRFRECRSILQLATKVEVTHELIDDVEKHANCVLEAFRTDWDLKKRNFVAMVKIEAAGRGLANSSMVSSKKDEAEREWSAELREMESECALVKTVGKSKRRLLDPTIA